MIRKIILFLLLTARYDAMEECRATGACNIIESAESELIDGGKTGLNPPREDSCTSNGLDNSLQLQVENLDAGTRWFSQQHNQFAQIHKAWEKFLKGFRAQEIISLGDIDGEIKDYYQKALDDMKNYIDEYEKSKETEIREAHKLKILHEMAKVIKGFTAIAMHVNKKHEERGKMDVVGNMGNDKSEYMTKQLQLMVLFGEYTVRPNLMTIHNLKTTAYYIDCMADRLESKFNIQTESSTAFHSRVDSIFEAHPNDMDIKNLRDMVSLIKELAHHIESRWKNLVWQILNSTDNLDSATEHLLPPIVWIERRARYFLFCVDEFVFDVNKNPSKWHLHRDEMMELLYEIPSILNNTPDIGEDVDKEELKSEIIRLKHSEPEWIARAQNLMIHYLGEVSPELIFKKSLLNEKTKDIYTYNGFQIGSDPTELESMCTIVGSNGEWFDAHSITVECKWETVKMALTSVLGQTCDALVMQIYGDGNRKFMVISGISVRAGTEYMSDQIGFLAEHLPTNESMNKFFNGGFQIQLRIDRYSLPNIEKAVEIITRHVEKNTSYIFLDGVTQEQHLTAIFKPDHIFTSKDGIGWEATVEKSADRISWLEKKSELSAILQSMSGNPCEIIDTSYSYSSSQLLLRSTYFYNKDIGILNCLHEQLEQPDSTDTKHLNYLGFGMMLGMVSVTDAFLEKLFIKGQDKWNFYTIRQGKKATHIGLIMISSPVDIDTNKYSDDTGSEHKEMMVMLMKKYQQYSHFVIPQGFSDTAYFQGMENEDVVAVIKQLIRNPKFVPNANNLKHLRSSQNKTKSKCPIQ